MGLGFLPVLVALGAARELLGAVTYLRICSYCLVKQREAGSLMYLVQTIRAF